MENLPIGVEGAVFQCTDLHGDGIPGILIEQFRLCRSLRETETLAGKLVSAVSAKDW